LAEREEEEEEEVEEEETGARRREGRRRKTREGFHCTVIAPGMMMWFHVLSPTDSLPSPGSLVARSSPRFLFSPATPLPPAPPKTICTRCTIIS
jgi:hypothetical protein